MGKRAATALDAGLLLGTWLCTDSESAGIVKVIISKLAGRITLRVYGACSPSPCDWGTVEPDIFTADAEAPPASAISANFDLGFMDIEIQGYVVHGVLVIVSFSRFRDASGRANYFAKDFFYRQHE